MKDAYWKKYRKNVAFPNPLENEMSILYIQTEFASSAKSLGSKPAKSGSLLELKIVHKFNLL